ncbi:hypothetical protein RRG08_023802 [Elysia crispata]|uniref:Uncharacterized protein n=1 Tax=Elysia crispata TaxID=231223 RepID=A0AAE0ZVQ3_9GAST|nr:hypothetical protein RRG08_023802 [Elysia crispata]
MYVRETVQPLDQDSGFCNALPCSALSEAHCHGQETCSFLCVVIVVPDGRDPTTLILALRTAYEPSDTGKIGIPGYHITDRLVSFIR